MCEHTPHASCPPVLLPFLVLLALFPLNVGATSGLAYGQTSEQQLKGTEFSARIIWSRGGEQVDALLFAKPDRYRLEHRGGVKTEYGYASVTIIREDQQELWYLFSERRVFVAVPLLSAHRLPTATKLEGEIERKRIGPGMIDGRAAILFEVVVERQGRREVYYQWTDKERGFVVKLLNKHRDWSIEYQHVVFSRQPGYYFDVPRGYQRIEAQELPRPFEEY